MADLRKLSDNERVRELTNTNLVNAFENKQIEGLRTSLSFQNVQVEDTQYTLADQKKALLNNRNLTVRVKGTMVLTDKTTGEVLDQKKTVLGHLPWRTGRGTYITKGNEYSVSNQFRLKYGVYSRRKANDEIEAHFNIQPGTGRSFRILMEPATGIFRIIVAQAKPPLYSLLHYAGVTDGVLEQYWGKEVLKVNKAKAKIQDVDKIYIKLAGYKAQTGLTTKEKAKLILELYNKMSMDAQVNRSTMKVPVNNVNIGLILKVTKKLIDINKGKEIPDDRDSLEYRKLHSAEDFFAERVVKDAGQTGKKLVKRLDKAKNFGKISAGTYTRALGGFITEDDKSATGEQLNPLEILEGTLKTTPLGEGGLSRQNVTAELPNVHPSHLGFLDPIRVPESDKAGLTLYLTEGTLKGDDGNLYREVLHVKSGKKKHVNTQNFHKYIIAFPGEWESKKKILKVMSNKKVTQELRSKVDYALLNSTHMFTVTSNLVPMMHTTQGNRLMMAAKIMPAALPLKDPEAALVQSKVPGKDTSFDNIYGKQTSAKVAPISGTITKVTSDHIKIKDNSGKTFTVDIYNNYPFNRKTSIHQTPVVKKGDRVKKGDLVARSNFTDDKGTLALGKNLRVAYMSYKGYNFEDGIVMSESAAKKMTSEHTYSYEIDLNDTVTHKKDDFISYFPSEYTLKDLSHIDSNGLAKKGSKVKEGQPLILAMTRRSPNATDISLGNVHKVFRNTFRNTSEVWDHHSEGEIMEAVATRKFLKVVVKSYQRMTIGDKISGRHGNKGIIAKILPDDNMPKDKDGKNYEILMNPQGIITRINPSQIHETLLGKAALKEGKPKLVENFHPSNALDYTKKELKKNGLKDTETVYDAASEKKLGDVLTGVQYFLKASSTAEKGYGVRGYGEGYNTQEQPTKGMSFGTMELNALVAHGARKVMRDAATRKGQRNDEMWKALRSGEPLPPPKVPYIFTKFTDTLKAGGINVVKKGNNIKVLPMTDKEVMEMSAGEVKQAKMLRAQDYKPESGGLFDEGLTGGITGTNWTHIDSAEPLPNPAMEEGIRTLLGLTSKKFRAILSGTEKLEGKIGGDALKAALGKINIKKEITKNTALAKGTRKTHRDKAIKRLRVLFGARDTGIHPKDWMISKVPVIPPVHRPISISVSGPDIVADSNDLYKLFIDSNKEIKEVKEIGLDEDDPDLQKIRLHNYDTLRRLYGIGKHEVKKGEKPLKGFISQIVGTSPKLSMFQNKVLKKRQDLTGRAVIGPDPELGIDQAGVPEDMAWKLYSPFVMRKLVELGRTPLDADEVIKNRTEEAKKILIREMEQRPVLVNRNPSLHKYNIMALYPKLTQDKILTLPPLIEEGFNADHDGDAMNIHVPVSADAVSEAKEKLLPSQNLFKGARNKAYWVPSQEAVIGLYRATKPRGTRVVRVFKTAEDAKKAYRQGKIKINDMIEVLNL